MANKKLKVTLIGFGAVILLIQAARPDYSNPPVKPGRTLAANVDVPAEVVTVFERSCTDCHSNRTRWPWYSQVAPISWLIAHDVKEGRGKMNIDDWGEDISFKEICKEVRGGGMPIKQYLLLHPDAKLTPQDVQNVCAWSQRASGR